MRLIKEYATYVFWISSGKIEINPREPVFLGCGPELPVQPDSIVDSLEANIVVVWSEEKTSKVVIVSVDSLFLGKDVSEQIVSGLSRIFRQEEVFLAASHTHTAPMIDETKPRLGIKSDSYAVMVVDCIVEEALRVASEIPIAVKLRKYHSTLGGIVERRNNRLFELSRFGVKWRPTLQRPNLRKKAIGADATIAEFLNERGDVIAALAVVPCHPVALMGKEMISADYVGGLRAEFRETICLNQEVPFVFLQGASGDLNPWWKPRWFDEGLVAFIDQIVNGIRFYSPAFSISNLSLWCKLRIQELISDRDRHLKSEGLLMESPVVKCELYQFPLGDFVREAHSLEAREVSVHWLQIGDLRLLGVSAEITSKLKQELKNLIGDVELVGCIRDSFGYATTSKQYREGGYEVEGHQWHFSIRHLDVDHPGQLLQKAIKGLSRNA